MDWTTQTVGISVRVITRRKRAVLVRAGLLDVWLPLSQIRLPHDRIQPDAVVYIRVSRWIAEQEGLL